MIKINPLRITEKEIFWFCFCLLQPQNHQMGQNRWICVWTVVIRCIDFHFTIRSRTSISINQVSWFRMCIFLYFLCNTNKWWLKRSKLILNLSECEIRKKDSLRSVNHKFSVLMNLYFLIYFCDLGAMQKIYKYSNTLSKCVECCCWYHKYVYFESWRNRFF